MQKTLRDEFALHAPPVPEWFMPILKTLPPKIPHFFNLKPEGFTEEEQAFVKKNYCLEADLWYEKPSAELLERYEQYEEKRSESLKKYYEVLSHNAMQPTIQWPYVYADAMLAERAKRQNEEAADYAD